MTLLNLSLSFTDRDNHMNHINRIFKNEDYTYTLINNVIEKTGSLKEIIKTHIGTRVTYNLKSRLDELHKNSELIYLIDDYLKEELIKEQFPEEFI